MKNLSLDGWTEEENLDRLFYLTSRIIYSPERYSGRDAAFQFELSAGELDFSYFLEIRGGRMAEGKGRHPNPDVSVSASVPEWLGIANRTLNPALSVMLGRTRVSGDMRLFQALGRAMDTRETPFQDAAEPWEGKTRLPWKRPEKILVINGSPRMKRGYTYYYLGSLIEGMEGSGAEVEVIDVYDKEFGIEPCRGCFSCWEGTPGGKCVLKDEASRIVEKIFDSYLTVYAFPLYIDSVPARLKALMDRQFIMAGNQFVRRGAFTRHPSRHETKERYIALFATNGFPEIGNFGPLRSMFKSFARSFNSPLIAEILRPGATALYEEPTLYPHLLKVRENLSKAGADLAIKGEITRHAARAIASLPLRYSKRVWYYMSNRFNKLADKRPPRASHGESPR